MQREADLPPTRNRALLLLGATGTGKTPLGEIIEQRGLRRTRCLHFDFGANLRDIVGRDRPDELIGRQDIDFLKNVLQSGALLEDEHFHIARRVLRSFMATRGADGGTCIVLNGLPRHLGQARAVDATLDVEAVVQLNCPSETILQRIRTNVGGDRTSRTDDNPEAIRKKLEIFHERTAPLRKHYARQGARIETIEATADMTPEQMWKVLDATRLGQEGTS